VLVPRANTLDKGHALEAPPVEGALALDSQAALHLLAADHGWQKAVAIWPLGAGVDVVETSGQDEGRVRGRRRSLRGGKGRLQSTTSPRDTAERRAGAEIEVRLVPRRVDGIGEEAAAAQLADAGDRLTAYSARVTARARLPLDQSDRIASLGEVHPGGQPGDTTADHQDTLHHVHGFTLVATYAGPLGTPGKGQAIRDVQAAQMIRTPDDRDTIIRRKSFCRQSLPWTGC